MILVTSTDSRRDPAPAASPSAASPRLAAPGVPATLSTAVTGLYWLAMFVGTHIPNPETLISPETSDKLLHFLAYLILYLLLAIRFRLHHRVWPDGRATGRLLLIAGSYAVLDEILQGLPGLQRQPDVLDALADAAGLLSAAIPVLLWRRVMARNVSAGPDRRPL